jgi:putative transposase
MIKTLKVRLYHNKEQKVLLEKHYGSCRFVCNYFFEVRHRYYNEHKNDEKKDLIAYDTTKMLSVLNNEITWLNEINTQSLEPFLVELDKAFKSFFTLNASYPTFNSKKGRHPMN